MKFYLDGGRSSCCKHTEGSALNSILWEEMTFKSIYWDENFSLRENHEQETKQMHSVKSYTIVKNDI